MDQRAIELLELDEIRTRVAGYAAFAPSRRMALDLAPSPDPVIVRRRLDETDEARAFLSERPDASIGGAHDIAPSIDRAARAGRLDPAELLAVRDTLVSAGRLADMLREVERPLLHALYREIVPLPALRARLEASIDPSLEILDSASPTLGGLRRAVRVMYERLRSRLETLVHGELGSALQEPIITLRNGRYVVPVRSEARSRVRGIVHDQSGSGQTLFVEPLIAVELGNAWREAQLSVQAEEERILDELSALVGSQAAPLRQTLDALARFDHWLCRARLAEEMDAVRAEHSARSDVVLLSARHPGLTGRVVPIDVRLGADYTALVITGPNTGGKTVALRTVGLLVLMHQSGLHVPAAPGSRLPVFRDVLADIGDEQSVAQSLSTFSGHLRAITAIVAASGPDTLVLLDELGAGTDPTEGSALAQALLDHFIRAGALVIATTHYAELKTYAHNTPQARNASVDFDLATLAPTYHLSIGLPGTSQAFAIAERLGLPSALVDDARARLSVAQQEFESTLASIKASQEAISAAEARAGLADARAADARREAEEERRRARAERREVLTEARRQAEEAIDAVGAEIAEARALLARQTLTEDRLDAALVRLAARRGALPEVAVERGTVTAPRRDWRVGERARSEAGWDGTVTAVDERHGRATLDVAGLRVEVPFEELLRPDASTGRARGSGTAAAASSTGPRSGRRGGLEPPATRGPAPTARSGRSAAPRSVASSLDLRGARVEEALELLERYLDRASMAGVGHVTIIHGHGSGAMRDAVRSTLGGHPLVRSWRPGEQGEGGDGATIVTL